MASDGLTSRPWYRWNVRDFYSDPAVAALEREERWRYRDALDAAWQWDDPAIGSEDDWREALDYSPDEWALHRRRVLRCLKVLPDGRWVQKRLRAEYEHATAKSRAAAAAGRLASAQRTLSERSTDAKRTPSRRSASAQRTPNRV